MGCLQQHRQRSSSADVHSSNCQPLRQFRRSKYADTYSKHRKLMDVHENEKKAQMGPHVSLLGIHLVEFMCRRRFAERPFEFVIRSVQEKYPV